MKKGKIFDSLEKNFREGHYPLHMPGHKRALMPRGLEGMYGLDITEIKGFDDLHHPDGMIKQEMELAKDVYGTSATYFLVNGSTSGIMAAICSCVRNKEAILMARNCHKSVYNAVKVRGIYNKYIMPDRNGAIRASDVEEELKKYSAPDSSIHIKAVVITSPTYEGVVSDVKRIAEVCHRYKTILIVDEAHGAHFLGYGDFPASAVVSGADMVVQSLHKTLPSLTQTALLHVCNSRLLSSGRIEEYLSVFESSSPSYLLIGSIDACLRFIIEEGERHFVNFSEMLDIFYRETAGLKNIKVLTYDDAFAHDKSKIVIKINDELQGMFSGIWLCDELREKYNIEMEMGTVTYALGILTIADDDEAFLRFSNALKQIDKYITEIINRKGVTPGFGIDFNKALPLPGRRYLVSDAEAGRAENVVLEDAEGRVARDFIYAYPPGIPIIIPGEIYDRDIINEIRLRMRAGLKMINVTNNATVRVIKE